MDDALQNRDTCLAVRDALRGHASGNVAPFMILVEKVRSACAPLDNRTSACRWFFLSCARRDLGRCAGHPWVARCRTETPACPVPG